MQKTLDLKHTLNLPRTPFSMKANLPQNEPKWLAKWAKEGLYGQIRAARCAGRKGSEGTTVLVQHRGVFQVNSMMIVERDCL